MLGRNSEVLGELEVLRCQTEDNIKADIQGITCEGVEWIHVTQDRNQRWEEVREYFGPHKRRGIC